MPSLDVLLFRLLLVVFVGGIIGAEREYRSKSAGFRTMILICLGSFLFTTFSIYISGSNSDRIASNIVTGIGFLGAGVIFRSDNGINGITTAATIWVVAALGMGIADGAYSIVLIATGVIMMALLLLTKLENIIDKLNQTHNYKIVSQYKEDLLQQYENLFEECHLNYKRIKQTKSGSKITGSWMVQGTKKNHKVFVEKILHDASVEEFEF
ncbi:MAG TPA: MgtC/SapB family protein [Chitinophagaceae bacterium]|jgi:putative Mg2+ transporter-C (MgtC) family protein|nr:MgtC/SapB family protein [Chitinophagaceae bacterium]